MSGCRIRVAQQESGYALRVEGRATWQEARRFEEAQKEAVERGALTCLVDLGDCSYLDSTFLGVLVRTSRLWRKSGRAWAIGAAGDGARRALAAIGLADLLPKGDDDPALGTMNWCELKSEASRREDRGFLLAAHEELGAAAPENIERFRAVTDALKAPPSPEDSPKKER